MIDIATIDFIWPAMLWLLLAIPVLAILYALLQARGRRGRRHYVSLEIIGEADGRVTGAGTRTTTSTPARTRRWRQHVPALLTLLALSALIFAVARPRAVILMPSRVETVMLAIDHSGSMRATDVKPTRMVAAQDAARAFIADQPRQMRVGVVGVAAAAAVVQAPTTNREDVRKAIDRLQPQRGTALGSGIIIALATLLPGADINVAELIGEGPPQATPTAPPKTPRSKPIAAVAAPNNASAIVLVTDGQSNTGPDPQKAADLAAEHGVRVFTVGIGTPQGTTVNTDGYSLRVRLDEEALKKIANKTNGEFFRAGNATDLTKIYRYIGAKMVLEKAHLSEVTSVFVALGALLAMVSGLLSMAWYNRIL